MFSPVLSFLWRLLHQNGSLMSISPASRLDAGLAQPLGARRALLLAPDPAPSPPSVHATPAPLDSSFEQKMTTIRCAASAVVCGGGLGGSRGLATLSVGADAWENPSGGRRSSG